MPEEYKPGRGEIAIGAARGLSRNNLKETGTRLGQHGLSFFKMMGFICFCPYVIPTIFRRAMDEIFPSSKKIEFDPTQNGRSSTAFYGGIASFLLQMRIYDVALRRENDYEGELSLLPLIPIATNVGSAFYEIARKIYHNAEQRVLQGYKSKNLEKTLSTMKDVSQM